MLQVAGEVRLEATWMELGSECGKGIFVLRRTWTILGRAEVPLPETASKRRSNREIFWLLTPQWPAKPMVNQWLNTQGSGTNCREKVTKSLTRAHHEILELFKAQKIPKMAHETAAVWDWSVISYSKESTEYPNYVGNYTGHLPYLVQSGTETARGQDTFLLL